MTMPMLRHVARSYDDAVAFTDFVKYAALVMTSRNQKEAIERAKAINASDRVQRVLKASVVGGTTSNAGLSEYGPLVGAFMDSLRNIGAFDRIATDAMRLTLHPGRVVVNSSAIIASAGTEGAAKPVKRLSLTPADMTPQKTLAQVVLSKELIDGLGDEGLRALGRELRASVALGTDTAAMTVLTATNSGESSNSASTFDSMLGELEELAHNVNLSAASRPYFVITPQIAKGLAHAATANGVTTMGVLGGEVMGTPVLVSDGQGTGKVTLVDATGLAVADEPIDLRSSEHASIEMDSAPSHEATTPTAAQMVSMFQTNCRCLLAERNFAVKVIRPSSVATLTSVEWGGGTDSPTGF
jgi:hypothetical protein